MALSLEFWWALIAEAADAPVWQIASVGTAAALAYHLGRMFTGDTLPSTSHPHRSDLTAKSIARERSRPYRRSGTAARRWR